jgi:hypothetical protein
MGMKRRGIQPVFKIRCQFVFGLCDAFKPTQGSVESEDIGI